MIQIFKSALTFCRQNPQTVALGVGTACTAGVAAVKIASICTESRDARLQSADERSINRLVEAKLRNDLARSESKLRTALLLEAQTQATVAATIELSQPVSAWQAMVEVKSA